MCKTQSYYFNFSMFNLLDKVLEEEKVHGPHRNPKLLKSSSGYSKFEPLRVCIQMREQCGEQVKIKSWPALTANIPQGNLGKVQEGSEKDSQKNKNSYKYHGCGSNYHFLRDCPKKNEAGGINGGGGVSGCNDRGGILILTQKEV